MTRNGSSKRSLPTTSGMIGGRIRIIQNLGFWPFSLNMFIRDPYCFVSNKASVGKPIARVYPTLESKGFSVLPGFGPAAEALLFRQKDPTTVALFETHHAK
jgi:hypothetical protein